MSKLQEYRVSLAVRVPMNFEYRTEATSKEDAFKKAMDAFHTGDMTHVDDDNAIWDDTELDVGKGEPTAESDGVYISVFNKKGEETEV